MIRIIKLVCVSDRGQRVGQDSPNGKLTNKEAEQIRQLHFEYGIGKQELARKFEVSRACIRQILAGKTYPEIYAVKRVTVTKGET